MELGHELHCCHHLVQGQALGVTRVLETLLLKIILIILMHPVKEFHLEILLYCVECSSESNCHHLV